MLIVGTQAPTIIFSNMTFKTIQTSQPRERIEGSIFMHCATTKWNILASKSFFFFFFIFSGQRHCSLWGAFGPIPVHVSTYFIYRKYLFFLPGVSLSSNYIPLVNEVNLQIIYYSGLGDGNGPFAGGGELKWFLAVLRGQSFLNGYNDLN